MKKIILIWISLFVFSCFVTYSQFEFYNPEATRTQHMLGDKILSVSPNILINTPNGLQMGGGIKIQAFLGKRVSLDADIVFARDYYHFGPGILGIPIAMLTFSDNNLTDEEGSSLSEMLFYVAAMALSFEHISYHIPLKNYTDIAPFISLLRFKNAYEHGNDSNPEFAGQQVSFATGVQLNKYFGKFVLSPYAEYNIGYKDHISGINIGVYCGFNFIKK
jgi:hypothetical protein